jgi:hypothetical protein
MAGFSATTVIGAPVEDVFRLISDITTHPSWAADRLTVEPTGERTWRTTSISKGARLHADLPITRSDPNRPFEFVVVDQTGRWSHRFILEQAGEACRVSRHLTPEVLNPGQRMLYWVMRYPVGHPALRSSLQRLAAALT